MTPIRSILKKKQGKADDSEPSPSPSSPQTHRTDHTLATLGACSTHRGGYTSPRLRQRAAERCAALLSLCDAAWEGDVAGLEGVLERTEQKDLNTPSYLKPHMEGLCYDAALPMKGYHLSVPPGPLTKGYSVYAATPLMYAIAAGQYDAVAFLLEKGADIGTEAQITKGGKDTATARDVLFVNTFFRCRNAKEVAEARALKELFYSKVPKPYSAVASINSEEVSAWLLYCGVKETDLMYGKWDAKRWVGHEGFSGACLEQWLCCDWKRAGISKLEYLKRLHPHLLSIINNGLPRSCRSTSHHAAQSDKSPQGEQEEENDKAKDPALESTAGSAEQNSGSAVDRAQSPTPSDAQQSSKGKDE